MTNVMLTMYNADRIWDNVNSQRYDSSVPPIQN